MTYDVVIVGAGPAGLTAARTLAAAGVRDVLVLERTADPGGLPRFAGHPGWGMLDFRRLWTGPTYARALADTATRAGVTIRTGASVVALHGGGALEVATPDGVQTLAARAVLLATGIREASRAARLLPGARPWGVLSTGAFQEMVYAGGMVPFRRPVVLGTELVAFSALLTARHAGLRVAAMIEAAPRITARRPGDWIARHLLGVPVLLGTRLLAIEGRERVEAVRLLRDGLEQRLACDGVIVSGHFVPEATLARGRAIGVDPGSGGPAIDSAWRTADPEVFAAGNVLRAVEHSGAVAAEGRAAAAAMLRALAGTLPPPEAAVPVDTAGPLRFVVPQRVLPGDASVRLQARATMEHRGVLRLRAGSRVLRERRIHALPERRLSIDVAPDDLHGIERLTLELA